MKEKLFHSLRAQHVLDDFIGEDPGFCALVDKLKTLTQKPVTILLIGETGTGKGRCAAVLHQLSERYNGPFIPYNCSAGPETLFESQLFGHVRGAFTGADKDRTGLVEEAHGGFLFLDEINSLRPESQVKLNHFLESGNYRRVGSSKIYRADIRIVAASNIDLSQEVRAGRFREDLYYRLAEYELRLPALRERSEDIIKLAEFFLHRHAHLAEGTPKRFSREAVQMLLDYEWPGNVRELENTVKRCIIDCPGEVIHPDFLPDMCRPGGKAGRGYREGTQLSELPWKTAKRQIVANFERQYLRNLLHRYDGVVAACARHAGIQSSDFWKLMRKYDLTAEEFRAPKR